MAGGGARRWVLLAVSATIVLSLAAVVALGGFRQAAHYLPPHQLGERVELGRFAITVHDVALVNHDERGNPMGQPNSFGGPGPKAVVLVRATVEMLDDKAGRFLLQSGLIVVRAGERSKDDLKVATGWGLANDLQPGLPVDATFAFNAPDPPPATVRVLLGEQAYEWSNLINPGPDWSSIAIPARELPDVRIKDETFPIVPTATPTVARTTPVVAKTTPVVAKTTP